MVAFSIMFLIEVKTLIKLYNDKKCFKSKISNSLLKIIVSFLNTDGGVIYIGVKNNDEIIGVPNGDESMRIILDMITDQISP